MSVKQRKFLNVSEKLEVIDTAEKFNLSVRKLSKKFGISKTQVAEILKKKADIRKYSSENVNLHRKRKFPNSGNTLLDHTVFDWVCRARLRNIRITGPVLRGTALEVAKELEMNSFKASNGWLEKFCLRWNITLKPGAGETVDIQAEEGAEWKEKFRTLIEEYSPEDIFAVDETALFFRALPEETFTLTHERCVGGKSSKERLTILFCTSMTGEKEKPLVIGGSKNPCYTGESVEWYFNENAWMTRNIMTEWLTEFDKRMQRKNRKVLLFLDNAMSHPDIILNNVILVFFPPSMTSYYQPLSQGVIHNFKLLYRKCILRRLLASMDESQNTRQLKKNVSVLNAVVWITAAWEKVKPELINKCFIKAGFGECIKVDAESDNEDDIALSTLMENQGINLFDYANIDEKLLTEKPEVEASCVHKYEEDCYSDSDEESTGVPPSVKNIKEAYVKLKDLETFFITHDLTNTQKITEIISYTESVILNNMISKV